MLSRKVGAVGYQDMEVEVIQEGRGAMILRMGYRCSWLRYVMETGAGRLWRHRSDVGDYMW
jgi:hypothetical protein